LAVAVGAVVVFVILGLASGMWIQLCLLLASLAIFLLTITLRKADHPSPGRGARIITLDRLPSYDLDEDLDEVA
jgi:hypothetical protein